MYEWQYLFWVIIGSPFVYYSIHAVRKPIRLFAPPLIASFGFVGVYVLNYVSKPRWVVDRFLALDGYRTLLILAVICLYAFVIGYELGFRQAQTRKPRLSSQKLVEVWSLVLLAVAFSGLAVFVVESGGLVAFFGAIHGTGGAWDETSAYLYNLPLFMFPGVYLLLAQWSQTRRLSVVGRIALAATLAYIVFQAVVFGNRGDTIRFCLMIGLGVLGFRRSSRMTSLAIMLVAGACVVAVLIFPYVRDALHLGATREIKESLENALDSDSINADVSGDELFYAAGVIVAVEKFGFYTYGLGWLIPILNFVPRAVWPGKHNFFAACCSFDVIGAVQRVAGYEVAGGSAYTGLVDGFIQWWWFSPFIWMLFGFWGGRWFRRLVDAPDVFIVGYVFAFDTALVYWVTQDFRAAFYPLLFIAVPIWVLSHIQSRLSVAERVPPILDWRREGRLGLGGEPLWGSGKRGGMPLGRGADGSWSEDS